MNTFTHNKKGQTLVIAIMVMFILAVISAVFIAMVARNLFRSQRFSNVDAVTQIAEAGVRFADQMLTTSDDGADWRPIPLNLGCNLTPVPNPVGVAPNYVPVQPAPSSDPPWTFYLASDPDFKWVRPYWPVELGAPTPGTMGYAGPTGGYTRYPTGQGRFLLRISYNPSPTDPMGKYIKIESIGRWGTVAETYVGASGASETDPTTLNPYADVQMRREITAFKPIGITDYARFITNKDKRSSTFALGCPGFQTSMGRFDSHTTPTWISGGPVRVNGNLEWYSINSSGETDLYLRGVNPLDSAGNPDTSTILPLDSVEVAGDIWVDPSAGPINLYQIINGVKSAVYTLHPAGTSELDTSIDLTNLFDTASGMYRDGSDNTDKNGLARGIKRMEPPLVDGPDSTNTTTRYRQLTLNSGSRVSNADGNRVNLGALGWGRGIYINNTSDVQNESQTLFGGYTLRYDWLKPNNPASRYWVGPYYVPPACIITLRADDSELINDPNAPGGTRTQYYFNITRTDTNTSGQPAVWSDAWGNPHPEWGQTVRMPYPDATYGRDVVEYGSDGKTILQSKHIAGNGVIFAEGNIRIRGMMPPGMQLTIVSNQNIYIDGNVLKYRDPSKAIEDSDPTRGADQTGGLALLAEDNICVNTTQFFSPLNSISADDVGSDAMNGMPPFHLIIGDKPDSALKSEFELGPWESSASGVSAPTSWMLYLRHSGEYSAAYIDAWLNPNTIPPASAAALGFNLIELNPNSTVNNLPAYVFGVGDAQFTAGGGIGSTFACDVFGLPDSYFNGPGGTVPCGVPNLLQIGLEQGAFARSNYLLGGLAVQPFDVRIEAVLYAQEGSFYVLPGNWFNPNSGDQPRNASGAPGPRTGSYRDPWIDPKFPFFGEPLDIRIIVCGAVSENVPAPISDVNEWMSKWADIPPTYGSSSTSTFHPGEGFTILYDDNCGWPMVNGEPIRSDQYGRALPIAPRLPVAGGLIYFGDVM